MRFSSWLSVGLAVLLVGGCKKSNESAPPAKSASSESPAAVQPKPMAHKTPVEAKPHDTMASAKPTGDGDELVLEGIVMTAPKDWKEVDAGHGGPMAPKAIFQIPNDNGDPGMVRITHFPAMKGKDELNIARWLGQVTQPNGMPSKREDAKVEMKQSGNVRLTIVDVSGSVKSTMRDAPKPGQRMIAAIVDHPKGPHFVVCAGSAELMEKRAADIMAFLESAKVSG